MTKIDVVSGFLGAGKTTLIKKLLKEALDGSKTVLIENEFGEIGIDGGFLKESGRRFRYFPEGSHQHLCSRANPDRALRCRQAVRCPEGCGECGR